MQLANVCHPEVDPERRRRVMMEVALEQGMDAWAVRLANRQAVGAVLAMRMLSIMETKSGFTEGYHNDPDPPEFDVRCWLAMVLVVASIGWFLYSEEIKYV